MFQNTVQQYSALVDLYEDSLREEVIGYLFVISDVKVFHSSLSPQAHVDQKVSFFFPALQRYNYSKAVQVFLNLSFPSFHFHF